MISAFRSRLSNRIIISFGLLRRSGRTRRRQCSTRCWSTATCTARRGWTPHSRTNQSGRSRSTAETPKRR
jgi:hypothetical protein